MTKKNIKEIKLTLNDIRSVFFRSNLLQASWNFERMQALGFCYSMIPIIKKLYPKNDEERKNAIKRHLEFFNTHPYVASLILGIIIAMEEKRANGEVITDSSINGLKIGLMGPLAGIGDPVFWGTIRPVLSALGAGIAMNGGILGPVLFFLIFNLIRLSVRYYGIKFGYYKGISIINDVKNGLIKKITEGASILGLFIMGALVNKWTHICIPYVISSVTNVTGKKSVTTIQSVLDQLMPGLVPLLLTLGSMWLIRKKINTFFIILGFFIISIFGYKIGLLGI